MKRTILIFLFLSTHLTSAQIKNGSFEIWDTIYPNVYTPLLDSFFNVPDPMGGTINSWTFDWGYGVNRTTDNFTGNYSLLLTNWYNYLYGNMRYTDSLSYRPAFMQGHFKYITGGANGLSQGIAKVTLTRFNGIANDTIATGVYSFDSTLNFTPFQVNLNYVSALNPDSIHIYFVNANSSCAQGADLVCNLLYLDNLTLTNIPLSIANPSPFGNAITVFPNPLSNVLNIQNNSAHPVRFIVYNVLGEKIISEILLNQTSKMDLSSYSTGIYFYKLTSDSNLINTGKLIKQ